MDVLGSAIEAAIYEESVTSTLSFTQTVIGGMAHYADVVSTLEFVDEATGKPVLGVTTTMELTDTAVGVRDIPRHVTDTLQLTQELVWAGPHYFNIMHFLPLEQVPYGHLAVVNVWVNDTLSFTERIGRTIYASVTDNLNLGVVGIKSNVVQDALDFSHTIAVGKGPKVVSHLELDQDCQVQGMFVRQVSQELGLRQAGAIYLETQRRFDRQYYPFVGFGSPTEPDAPPTALVGPMDGITAPFQLVYPATGEVTDSVTLRAPNLGNVDRLAFNRVHRETRGGTLVVFADPIWPKTQTLVLSFSGMTRSEAQDFLEFMADHFGQEIGLIDWESRYWRGIVTASDPASEDSPNRFSLGFEFEGQQAEWLPQIIPVTPGTPRRRTKPTHGATPDPMEPIPPMEPMTETYAAEADSTIAAGQPLYVKPTGHMDLACANDSATKGAVGFAVTAATPGFVVEYVTEGKLTLTDWTVIAGAAALEPGADYYLDATTAGRITKTAPSASGLYVVRLGRATSTLTLDIEIEPSVRL
ncbi:MAG: hypothetical protein PHR35_20430 [Kiritimatiellae bacterium]|nr:hypothetical protein [Kiritimatiellia bacterium]